MVHQSFGGQWTEKKLDCLRKYLISYMTIMKSNEKAKYFTTNYVDAFAGSGYIQDEDTTSQILLPGIEDEEQNGDSIRKGSPCIALEIDPPFDKYIFIEKDPENIKKLRELGKQFPNRDVEIVEEDANTYLQVWCGTTNWNKNRAVVFLDPFGMQVDWSMLESIAATKSIDLWLLVPQGMGLVRMLTKKSLPSSGWENKITRFLGTEEWKTRLYETQKTPTLFGEEENTTRIEDCMKIGDYVIERLKSIFFDVAPKPLVLMNSRNNPLYLLVFAVGNERGAGPALRIAKYLIDNINN